MGIIGLLVEVIGFGVLGFGGLGKEQSGNGFADGFVGHDNRAWMNVDLDGGMAGNFLLSGKATGDQV